jgi:hypothetical protein
MLALVGADTRKMLKVMHHRRPNQALKPTAGRLENYKVKLESRKLKGKLAPASDGSSLFSLGPLMIVLPGDCRYIVN